MRAQMKSAVGSFSGSSFARKPRYPQRHAEIMGGRIPVALDKAEIPTSLKVTRVGPVTAAELRWTGTDG